MRYNVVVHFIKESKKNSNLNERCAVGSQRITSFEVTFVIGEVTNLFSYEPVSPFVFQVYSTVSAPKCSVFNHVGHSLYLCKVL